MLIVPVMLHAGGKGRPARLEQLTIVNDESGSAAIGNYNVFTAGIDGPVRKAAVRGYARQENEVMELVTRALLALGYGKGE
jgi:hypothetical protein